jgi:predicted O-methyltransferase YrrM
MFTAANATLLVMAGFETEGATMAVLDPAAQGVVDRLHATSRGQMGALLGHFLPDLPKLLMGRPIGAPSDLAFYDNKLLPLEPAQGELLYLLARARDVRCAVEFGTSFGVSTIYLAAALRDAGAGGRVIGTELAPQKVAAATRNIADAGLTAQVDIRQGDARATLRELTQPVDLLLLDGWPSLAMEVLQIVEPRLAAGAIVFVDNVGQFPGDLRAVIERLTTDPRYRSSMIPLRGGTLVGVYDGSPAQSKTGET